MVRSEVLRCWRQEFPNRELARFLSQRQPHDGGGASAKPRQQPQATIMAFEHPLGNRQSESSASLLGGEERLKDIRACLHQPAGLGDDVLEDFSN
jgi:hypothetical protein